VRQRLLKESGRARVVNRLVDELPQAIQQIVDFAKEDMGLDGKKQTKETMVGLGGVLKKAGSVFSVTMEALADAVIVFFVSLYLAYNPRSYVKGFLRLVPPGLRDNASKLIDTLGDTLKWWLIGIFMMMLVVGVLSGVGLWLLNIPLALTLGILAGLLTFIPYFGPIVSAIPAILMALLVDLSHAVYVILLYLVIHIIEGYILSPLVQQRTVYLPPILTLAAIAGMSVLLGIPGLIVATPATAILLVLVKKIYIEEILGDKETV
jgi:predicted PurR-regulated permease PerM